MKLHKQKLLVAAMAAGAASLAGVAGAQTAGAGAIALNPDGLGEALVYPYYSARNGTTLMSVVNTTTQGKVVKVRFREAKNSNDVLDFNLFLSPYDVWTGAVNAKGDGAYLTTNDTSCTYPAKSSWDNVGNGTYGVAFFPYEYDLVDGSSPSQGLDRTMEGYVEIIEQATVPAGSALYTSIKHVSGVAPCTSIPSVVAIGDASIAAPSGGMFGAVTYISTAGGTSAGMSTAVGATAYNGFNRTAQVYNPNDQSPNFSDHGSCRAVVGDASAIYLVNFGATACGARQKAQAFAATNMASNVYGEYSYIGNGSIHATDWVITMPGKHFFTNYTADRNHGTLVSGETLPVAPFQNIWSKTKKTSCDDIGLLSTSREEDRAQGPGPGFSPRPPDTPGSALCNESNVISFAKDVASGSASNVMGSKNALFFTPQQPRGESGWLDLSFTATGTVTNGVAAKLSGAVVGSFTLATGTAGAATGSATISGLPVVGFAATNAKLTAGSASVPANNYNSSAPLAYKRTITLGQ